MLTPEKIAELQKQAREQPLEQQQWLHRMLERAEKHGMAEPGMSEKFKPQPPEGQTTELIAAAPSEVSSPPPSNEAATGGDLPGCEDSGSASPVTCAGWDSGSPIVDAQIEALKAGTPDVPGGMRKLVTPDSDFREAPGEQHTNADSKLVKVAKGLGVMAISLGAVVALLFLCAHMLHGLGWIAERVLPWLMAGVSFATVFSFVVLLPLSLFRFTRVFSANCLLLASYLFGVSVWLYGFLITYTIWGTGALVLGLLLGLVGVVPIAILAAALTSQWWIVFDLVWFLGLTYGSRAYSLYLIAKIDRLRNQEEGTYSLASDRDELP